MQDKSGKFYSNKYAFSSIVIIIFTILAFMVFSSNSITNPTSTNNNISGVFTFNCTINEWDTNATNVSFYLVNTSDVIYLGTDYNKTAFNSSNLWYFNITYNTTLLGDGQYTLYCNATNINGTTAFVTQNLAIDNNAPIILQVVPSSILYNDTKYDDYPLTLQVNITDLYINTAWFILNSLDNGQGSNTTKTFFTSYYNNSTTRIYSYNLTSDLTSIYTRPGTHSVYFCANDSVGNTACNSNLNGYATSFVIRGLNVTQAELILSATGTGFNITYENGTDVPTNAFMNPILYNYTLILNKTGNDNTRTELHLVGLQINESLLLQMNNTNLTSTLSSNITSQLNSTGLNATNFAWLDVTQFLPTEALYKYGKVTFSSLYSKYYYCSGSTTSSAICADIIECNSSTIDISNYNLIIPTNSACYNIVNSSVEFYLDHFSGVIGANDTSGPNLTIYSPTSNQVFTSTVLLNLTANDTYSNISSIGYYLDNSSLVLFYNASTPSQFVNLSINITPQISNHSIKFWSNDSLGNSINSSRIVFIYDTYAPNVTIIQSLSIQNNTKTSNTTINFAWNYSDNGPYYLCNLTVKNSSNNAIVYNSISNNSPSSYVSLINVNLSNSTTLTNGYYNWNVTCTDQGGLTTITTTRNFTVDSENPTLSLTYPQNGQSFIANITINYTSSDFYTGLNSVGYYLDSYSFQMYNSSLGNLNSLNGTMVLQNITTGTHNLIVSINDSVGNKINSSSVLFTVVSSENITALSNQITAGNVAVNSTTMQNSSGAFLNGTQDINQSILLTLLLNDALQDVTVKIPFNGANAEWNKTQNFTVDLNTSGNIAQTIISNSATNLTKIVFFNGFSNFLNTTKYSNVSIFVNTSIYGLDLLYLADDLGNSIYEITNQCYNNTAPSLVSDIASMCYINTSTNVTFYIPHLSGIAIGNDTVAPSINITYPTVSSPTIANSQFYLTFNVSEVNPAAPFCNYTIKYAGSLFTSGDLYNSSAVETVGIHYSFSVLIPQLTSRNYNATVTCKDLGNHTSSVTRAFTISDTTTTNITSISDWSNSSAARIYWTTGEYTNSTVKYGTSTALGTIATNTSFYTLHNIYLSGLSASTTYYYNITSCDINALCNTTGRYQFTTSSADEDTSSSSSSSSGGGAVGDSTSVSQAWDSLPPGVLVSKSISNSYISVTKIAFALLQAASNAQLTISYVASQPSGTTTPTDKTYQYFQITKTNIPDVSLNSADIQFKVPKSWITTNNISEDSIALIRWNNGAWNKLETNKVTVSSLEITYLATTPGFSYFAITGKNIASMQPSSQLLNNNLTTPSSQNNTLGSQQQSNTTGNLSNNSTGSIRGNNTSSQTSTSTTKSKLWLWIIIILGSTIIAVVIAYLIFMNKGKGSFGGKELKENNFQQQSNPYQSNFNPGQNPYQNPNQQPNQNPQNNSNNDKNYYIPR